MPRTPDGKCDDYACPALSRHGYCQLTACIKTINTTYYDHNTQGVTTTTNPNLVTLSDQISLTDFGMEHYIDIYLKDHSAGDLLRLIAKRLK
jgi:hypothetical protein